MVQDHNCNCFGQRLISFMRAAALPAALGMLWHAPCAFAQESQKTESPAASSSDSADEATLPALPANLGRVPQPQVAPPVNRKKPALIHVTLEAKPVIGLLADGIGYKYWTYNGTVPGPMIRVRQGDMVELTLHNATDSPVSHSIDSEACLGPAAAAKLRKPRQAQQACSNSKP